MDSLGWITVARPYAKAIFEVAMDEGAAGALSEWSDVLARLSQVLCQPEAVFFIKRPDILPEESVAVFSAVLDKDKKNTPLNLMTEQFLKLLAETGRLGALQAIYDLYEHYRADYEKTIDATVLSFEPLTKDQQSALISALKKRLKRDVRLTTEIDKSLLGGAIVQAGDLVMDGSVRGKIQRLSDEMMK